MSDQLESREPGTKEMLEHAWRYFALHAAQRLSLFNFFVVISLSASAGIAACIQRGGLFHLAGVGLGAFLALASFVFWKLDQRTAFLVRHGEAAIAELEATLTVPRARLVYSEPERFAPHARGFFLFRMWTYGTSFRLVFIVMGVVGVLGGTMALVRYFAEKSH